jgi:phosphoglycerate dehydrogenase-like enzyme
MIVLTPFGERSAEDIRVVAPGVDAVEIPSEGDLPDGVTGDAAVTLAWGSPNLPQILERGVSWVHTIGTGVDRFPLELITEGVTLTCSRGASAIPIAEWVLAAVLAFEKQFPDSWLTEPLPDWEGRDFKLGGLAGRNLGLIGFGGIAQATATRALAFGMDVRAVRRSSAPSPIEGVEMGTSVTELAAWADHLVVAAPATADTRHLVGPEVFAAIKPGAHLVNIARGSLVDQDALRAALEDDRVAMATLDTVDPEPLPAGHWMYDHPRVRVSPHISWSAPGSIQRLFDCFLDNVRRRAAGEPLTGVVDLTAGY